jgi:hypothetical protein
MKRTDDWNVKANFHLQKMQDCRDAFKACIKAFQTNPATRHIIEAVWREYKHHQERYINCINEALGEHELPTRS